jgi:hypothetical protein
MAEKLAFARMAGADRLKVTDNLHNAYAEVTDLAVIAAVCRVLESVRDGWYLPPGGPRIIKLQLHFYQGKKFVGTIGAGRKYFTAHEHGEFLQRDVDAAPRAAILAALGMLDPEPA